MVAGQFGVHGLYAQKVVKVEIKHEQDLVQTQLLHMGEAFALERKKNFEFATLKLVQVISFIFNRSLHFLKSYLSLHKSHKSQITIKLRCT